VDETRIERVIECALRVGPFGDGERLRIIRAQDLADFMPVFVCGTMIAEALDQALAMSARKPSAPRSSQKRITFFISARRARTSGWLVGSCHGFFGSGWAYP